MSWGFLRVSLEKKRVQAQAHLIPDPRVVDFAKVQNFMVSGYFSISLDLKTSPIKKDLKIFCVGASRLKFYSMIYCTEGQIEIK